MPRPVLQLDSRDNVLIALTDLKSGEAIAFAGQTYVPTKNVPAKHKVATPANWKQGDDVIISGAVSNEEADKTFPGYKTVKPYLRTATQPR